MKKQKIIDRFNKNLVIEDYSKILFLITGNGLKDVKAFRNQSVNVKYKMRFIHFIQYCVMCVILLVYMGLTVQF